MAVLRVLLLILKIIGITLLVILGVVLFLLLVILLAPVRYKGKFKKAEEPEPLLLADDESISLTAEGFLVSNTILAEILPEE